MVKGAVLVDHQVWQKVNATLQAYADALDRADLDALLVVFSKDAVLDYTPGAPRKGHSEILDHFEERQSKMERTSHHVGPPVVTSTADGSAFESTSYFIANHLLAGGGQYTVYGRYIDVFKDIDGMMKITRRRIVAHMTEGTNRQYIFVERKTIRKRS